MLFLSSSKITLTYYECRPGVLATFLGEVNASYAAGSFIVLSKMDLLAFRKLVIAGVIGTVMLFWLS